MTDGSIAYWVVTAWIGFASLFWIVAYARGGWTLLRLPRLADVEPAPPTSWPRLSVIIPACNEADTIEAALGTLLEQSYPELELVVVDDRSTDGTGEIIDRIAATDPRVRAVHVATLPDGWLGKVHALHVGAKQATGEWLLFTDADIHYAAGTLRKTVALAAAEGIDMLVLIPLLRATSVLHEAVVNAFGGLLMQSIALDAVADPDSEEYVGGGAFNLVRREAFDRSEGFEHIRLEVADDVGLGLVMKRAGARQAVWLATREVQVLWYPSVGAMVRGLEKNLFAVAGHYRLWRVILRLIQFALVITGPFVGLFVSVELAIAGGLALACLPIFGLVVQRRLGHRFLPTLLVPVGQLVMMYMLARSTWKCLRSGAVEWRGTRYPLALLAEHQRVKV